VLELLTPTVNAMKEGGPKAASRKSDIPGQTTPRSRAHTRETGISILNNPPISADDLFFKMEAHGLTETVDLFKPYAPSKGVLDQ
jgi:hypothetical protein